MLALNVARRKRMTRMVLMHCDLHTTLGLFVCGTLRAHLVSARKLAQTASVSERMKFALT
jgi:hypothetical protein